MRVPLKALSLLLAVVACSDSNGPQLRPASFAAIDGIGQVDTVGRELKDMIALRVIATDGASSVPNYPINWTALDGGQVFAPVAYSGTDGVARQRWTLGTIAGTQRLIARALDPETGAVLVDDTVTAMGTADVAFQVLPMVGVTQVNDVVVPVGDSAWVWVDYRDIHGNRDAPCADAGTKDRLTWSSADSTKALPRETSVNGKDEVGTWIVSVAPGALTISAQAGDCVSAASGPGGRSTHWNTSVQ